MTTSLVFVGNAQPDAVHFYQERIFNAMASKQCLCPLSFRPSLRWLPPIGVPAAPSAVWDQQLFVKQLDAQVSTLRNLNEGETI
jgi:hypothetical protein